MRDRYASALTFHDFVEGARTNQELWRDVHRLAKIPPELIERANVIPGRWHLLALVEDWCGDAVNTVSVLARLVESTPNIELRLLARDENLDIMDAHLSNGARAIPVVIALDEEHTERGWWGSRPRELQEWFLATGRAMDKESRYRHIRAWYARDRGRTAMEEIVEMVELGSRKQRAGSGELPRG